MSAFTEKAKIGIKYYRNKLQGRPLTVNLEVTKRCNATCDFCDYWKTKQENTIKDYGPIIKKIDPMMVTITGGEPMLRTDLVDIIKGIRKEVPVVFLAMITNGSLMTYEKAKKLYEAGLNQIAFSVDYLDDRHDTSRGIPNLWNHLSTLIPTLTDIGFESVQMNWIVMEENFDQTLKAAELCKSWGINISYTSYSDLKNMNDSHFLSSQNMNTLPQVIDDLKSFKRKNKTIRSSDYYLDRIPTFYGNHQIPGCPAGLKWIQVTPEGWFKACSELPPVVHWEDYDHKTSFKQQDCTLCWYSCRGENQTPIDFQRAKELANLPRL
ncbi:MAG: radical SAM protein [Bdellovibrionales bacterium]|nr:radical SAM protein [Bdellovibrionales bacterium]